MRAEPAPISPPPARSDGLSTPHAALVLLIVALVARWQTFGNPVIGFDEQFYLLVGDRLLQGAVPYVDLFDRKPIGLFLIYAAIRSVGGDGFLAYKIAALLVVVTTATGVFLLARRRMGAGPWGALAAATLYSLWLDFMEGEGGQSPVFYNLVMVAAAAVTLAAIRDPAQVGRRGAGAMLLVGVALQIKYSVLLEGIFFGCALIVAGWRAGRRGPALALSMALWIGCALLPTALAMLAYAAIGRFDAFWFANIVSVLAQGRAGFATQLTGLATIIGILSPLVAALLFVPRAPQADAALRRDRGFVIGWLIASCLGVILFWRFASPHYALPILVPLTIALAPALEGARRRRIAALALGGVALVGGQVVLALSERAKGGAAAAHAVAAAARGPGCIYVYDGYPALYMLTRSCVPTRYAFPGSLNTADEADPRALGVDPAREVARIMATHPVAVIDDYPRFSGGNPATRAVLARALAADYRLAACIATGPHRVRLVYRRKDDSPRRPVGSCPTAALLAAASAALPG